MQHISFENSWNDYKHFFCWILYLNSMASKPYDKRRICLHSVYLVFSKFTTIKLNTSTANLLMSKCVYVWMCGYINIHTYIGCMWICTCILKWFVYSQSHIIIWVIQTYMPAIQNLFTWCMYKYSDLKTYGYMHAWNMYITEQ